MTYFNYKREEDLAESIKESLRSKGITTEDGTTGSISDVLASALGREMYRLAEEFEAALGSESLENAFGENLDLYASKYFAGSITRVPESKAKVSVADLNISLINNTNENIFVQSGSEITNSNSREISFLITGDFTVPANNSIYISAEAKEIGTEYNVGKNYLDFINVSGVSVLQEKAITNGSFEESDSEFKNRISALSSLNGLRSERLINLGGLSYPGKFNVDYYQNYYGPGISGVFQYYENTQPESSKESLSNILQEYSFETREIKQIVSRKISFEIYTSTELSSEEKNNIKVTIKNEFLPGGTINFSSYSDVFKKISIFKDDLFFDEIVNELFYVSEKIELIGDINFIYEGDVQ